MTYSVIGIYNNLYLTYILKAENVWEDESIIHIFAYSYTIQVRYFYSRLVVFYTFTNLLILYIQTHISRNFLCQNHERFAYFHLQFRITHSRPLRSVDQSKIYTGCMWIMCATFGIFLYFVFAVWPISELHKAWRYY